MKIRQSLMRGFSHGLSEAVASVTLELLLKISKTTPWSGPLISGGAYLGKGFVIYLVEDAAEQMIDRKVFQLNPSKQRECLNLLKTIIEIATLQFFETAIRTVLKQEALPWSASMICATSYFGSYLLAAIIVEVTNKIFSFDILDEKGDKKKEPAHSSEKNAGFNTNDLQLLLRQSLAYFINENLIPSKFKTYRRGFFKEGVQKCLCTVFKFFILSLNDSFENEVRSVSYQRKFGIRSWAQP